MFRRYLPFAFLQVQYSLRNFRLAVIRQPVNEEVRNEACILVVFGVIVVGQYGSQQIPVRFPVQINRRLAVSGFDLCESFFIVSQPCKEACQQAQPGRDEKHFLHNFMYLIQSTVQN